MNTKTLEDLEQRIAVIQEDAGDNIICFPEISLTPEQLAVMAEPMFGWDAKNLRLYYKKKIHAELLLTKSRSTTSEDVVDFQELINLGIKALASGMQLDDEKVTNIN